MGGYQICLGKGPLATHSVELCSTFCCDLTESASWPIALSYDALLCRLSCIEFSVGVTGKLVGIPVQVQYCTCSTSAVQKQALACKYDWRPHKTATGLIQGQSRLTVYSTCASSEPGTICHSGPCFSCCCFCLNKGAAYVAILTLPAASMAPCRCLQQCGIWFKKPNTTSTSSSSTVYMSLPLH